ncbi:MAG TPA: hypothetical protein VFJ84_03695 [Candidatus Saccharimonadales bacterium]|nr:hypothetical protein [Candidatus Saccharimonadales bacterium]
MKKLFSAVSILFLGISLVLLMPGGLAHAYTNNDLIDDYVFDNTNAMTAGQIDSWLNTFPSSCISPNSGFTAPDPTGYTPDASFVDGHYAYGSAVSAGTVVYHAAIAHGLNPQVLLTKLQNEEGLVDGSAPYGCGAKSMASATGYACTDSGTFTHNYSYTGASPYTNSSALVTPLYYRNGTAVNSITGTCVNQNVKAGFSEQVVHAAWLLSFSSHKAEGQTSYAAITGSWNHCEDNATCPASYNIPSNWACYSGLMTQGYLKRCPSDASTTYFDGSATIDGQSLHMDTGATAALYVYTPHIQSFSSIFTNYFGSTTGPFYTVSSQANPPSSLEYGHTATATITLNNTSTQTWYADGSEPAGVHPFRLMTAWYANTPFADTSNSAWLGTQNQIKMSVASVAPGAQVTFTIPLKAPQYSTSQTITWWLVQDGVQVHRDRPASFTVKSVPDYAYSLVSDNVPPAILPGDAYQITIKLKNTGAETWYNESYNGNPANASGHPIRLATSGYTNSPFAYPGIGGGEGWLTQNQISMVEPSVAPGSTGTFQAIIFAPYKQLTFNHAFRLVLDGVKFIGGPGISSQISIPEPVASYSIVSRSGPSTMTSGQTATFTVTVKNTGNMIWRNVHRKVPATSTELPLRDVRMMTWAPGYHTSYFWYTTPEWMGSHNQLTPSTNIAGPGKTATYSITFRAPPVSKKTFFNEQWTLVLDGQTVMPFQGLTFPITVNP